MADPEKAHEPSMEEILASIRRIISDESEGAEGEAGEGENAPPEDAFEAVDAEADMAAMLEDSASEESADDTDPDDTDPFEIVEIEAEAEPEPEQEEGEPVAEDDDVFELTDDLTVETEAEEDAASAEEIDFDAIGEEVEAAEDLGDIDFADMSEEEPEPESELEPEPEPQLEPAAAAASGLLSSEAQATASAAFGALASTMLSHSGGARTLEQIVEDLLRPRCSRHGSTRTCRRWSKSWCARKSSVVARRAS